MFRKYYREANDDIKPDETFINSVIESAKKRRPPAYSRYVKYAAAAAAAVVVVSGAVLSMPLWQRVSDDKDGVIIEETVTGSSAPRTEEQTEAAQPSPNTSKQSQSTPPRAASSEVKPSAATRKAPAKAATSDTQITPKTANTAEKAETADTEVQENVSYEDAAAAYADEETVSVSAAEADNAETESYDAGLFMMSKMLPEEAADSAPAYAKEAAGGGAAMPDAPHVSAPTGYYSTYASDTYYEFENGREDFVTVSMFYSGGEDTAPVYAGGDGEYTAELVKDGYDVSVYGSDEAAVEEIINSLR